MLPGEPGAGPVRGPRRPPLAPLGHGDATDQLVGGTGAALGLGHPGGERQGDLPVIRRGVGQAHALGREVVPGGQMTGGEELLKGAVREGELTLAILFALADQQPGAVLDVLDHNGGLVQAVVQQWPEGAQQPALADVGGAVRDGR